MATEEQRILITQARTGMLLSRPVTLPNKISLCGTGTTLTNELIQRFVVRGIKYLFVQGTPLTGHYQASGELQLEHLRSRFSRVQDSAMMRFVEHCIEEELSDS